VDDDDAPDAPVPAPDEGDRFVTLARCGTAVTADFIRSLLDQAGIESVLQDQYLSQIFAFLTGPIGGVRVQVRRRDLAAALEVLRHPPAPLAADVEPESAAKVPTLICPECGSTTASFVAARPEGFLIPWIERVVPLPFLHGHWVCRTCGKRWLEVTAPRA
jgi:hypothetical protein